MILKTGLYCCVDNFQSLVAKINVPAPTMPRDSNLAISFRTTFTDVSSLGIFLKNANVNEVS